MQFDKNQLERLLSLDDESFKALTKTIAEAAGASKSKTEAMLNNPDLLKRRLSSLSESEANQILMSAGREKSEEILRMLRERGVDVGQ